MNFPELLPPPPALQPRSAWTSVLSDMAVKVRIGIHAHEQLVAQPLRVSVRMTSFAVGAEFGSDLAHCIDYDSVRDFVLAWETRPQVALLEQLARELLDHCFGIALVDLVVLRLSKTEVFPETPAAGIEVTMLRSDWFH